MPEKNSVKTYIENGYYHIYNRGVDKRTLFQDLQDYGVYLSYLKEYLSPKDEKELHKKLLESKLSKTERFDIHKKLRTNNYSREITLLAYCLMPNHFHLFIMQKSSYSIDRFMKSLSTRYAMYFNRKYQRVGSLYQGIYKAVLITSEAQYLHLTRYIHKQALVQGSTLQQPSSYPDYIGSRNTPWVHPEEVLSFFSKTKSSLSYGGFVEEYDSPELAANLTIEND
jgi:putative transposase